MVKRVLVTGAANIGKAGVATIVFKWGQEFDSNTLVYDYLMQSGMPEEQYQQAIINKGGKMYTCDGRKSMLGIIKWVTRIIKENEYKTLHINSDSAYIAAAYIYAAKKAGIEEIYVHSHCTQIDDTNKVRRTVKIILHKFCKPYVCRNTKMFLACSKVAGLWMFGKKNTESVRYRTIYNGVEVEKYLYDVEERRRYRTDLNIQTKFTIGNIGRLSYQKNQEFLIKLFSSYHLVNPDSILLIVGEGEMMTDLKRLVNDLNIGDSVRFLGLRHDVPKLLSAFDLLVMPSRFEGLPVTMVEAQMSDLPCVVSNTISKEAKFTDKVIYVDGWDVENWIKAIDTINVDSRVRNGLEKEKSQFNIRTAARELQNILCM